MAARKPVQQAAARHGTRIGLARVDSAQLSVLCSTTGRWASTVTVPVVHEQLSAVG